MFDEEEVSSPIMPFYNGGIPPPPPTPREDEKQQHKGGAFYAEKSPFSSDEEPNEQQEQQQQSVMSSHAASPPATTFFQSGSPSVSPHLDNLFNHQEILEGVSSPSTIPIIDQSQDDESDLDVTMNSIEYPAQCRLQSEFKTLSIMSSPETNTTNNINYGSSRQTCQSIIEATTLDSVFKDDTVDLNYEQYEFVK
jgi:hypothetical protein